MSNKERITEGNESKPKKKEKTYKSLKKYIFLLGWIYLFSKVFIIDLEQFLFNKFNLTEIWVLKYRFIISIILASSLWIYLGTLRFFKNVGLFLLVPFKILFWNLPVLFAYRIPKKIVEKKYWILLLGYINSSISFFRNLKYNLLKVSLVFFAILVLFNSTNAILLWWSLVVFSGYLMIHFYGRINLAIQPINIFNLNIKMLNLEKVEKFLIPEIILTEEEKTDSEKLIRRQNQHLKSLLVTKIALNFIGEKLQSFSNKGVFLLYMLGKVIITFNLCIVMFTFINYALYKISFDNFQIRRDNPVTVFDFLVYSFYSIIPDGVYVEPISNIAWSIKMISSYIGVVLIGIFLMSGISIFTTNYEKTIEVVVNYSSSQAKKIEKHLLERYSLGLKEAVKRLKETDSTIIEYLEELDDLSDKKIE